MKFIHDDFLLSTETAKRLYHGFAEPMPIIDYHCHLSPQEIAEDKVFDNISQLWLSGDHYKWRLMRSCGIDERYITGDGSDKEKFLAWAQTIEKCPGNPLYHWTMLELKRYFDYDGVLSSKNAEEVWEHCNRVIADQKMSAREIIAMSGVSVICTTDNPEDDLKWHKMLAGDSSFKTKVLPAFRPDKAVKITAEGFGKYIGLLEERFGCPIASYVDLLQVLKESIRYFQEMGCRTSDHGLDRIPYRPVNAEEADRILVKALRGEGLTADEVEAYQTRLLLDLGELYADLGWVMQLHYGAKRNNNTLMYEQLGPDTGYDCIAGVKCGEKLPALLNALEIKSCLPKTIIYSLDPTDNAMIDTVCGCFHEAGIRGKVQHGSAWWFNDHLAGMRHQLSGLAESGVLDNFVGMLTDSRSLLSYTRHEYFRRILCGLMGEWIDQGLYPPDMETAGAIVENVCYYNAKELFNL